jgi:GWxTD domain-containing protein
MPLLLGSYLIACQFLLAQATPAAPAPEGVGREAFQKWLNQDVVYIIKPEERSAAFRLVTDNQRREFVEQFWLRRDKEAHYRRIAYANSHFATASQGWKTDRGRIYIVYGPPDEIEAHPAPAGEVGSEAWRYRRLEGRDNVTFGFADRNGSGDYILTHDPTAPSPR